MNHGMKGHSPLRKTLTGFNTQYPLIRHIKDHYLREYRQHSKISNLSKNSVRTNRGRWLRLLSSWAHGYDNETKQVYSYPNVLGRCWPITHLHATQKIQRKSKTQEATKRCVIIGSCQWNALCHLWAKQKAGEHSPIGKTWPTKIGTLFPATLMYSFSCERIHFKRPLKVFNWLLNFKRAMRERIEKLILPQWNFYIPDFTRHWNKTTPLASFQKIGTWCNKPQKQI